VLIILFLFILFFIFFILGDEEMLRREVSVLWKMLNIDGNEGLLFY